MPQNILTFCGNVKLCEIDNSDYRTLNHVDTLSASSSLRQLKEIEIFIAKNHGSATDYTPGLHFMASLSQSTEAHIPLRKGHIPLRKEHILINTNLDNLPFIVYGPINRILSIYRSKK
jgi:hypothetical protein